MWYVGCCGWLSPLFKLGTLPSSLAEGALPCDGGCEWCKGGCSAHSAAMVASQQMVLNCSDGSPKRHLLHVQSAVLHVALSPLGCELLRRVVKGVRCRARLLCLCEWSPAAVSMAGEIGLAVRLPTCELLLERLFHDEAGVAGRTVFFPTSRAAPFVVSDMAVLRTCAERGTLVPGVKKKYVLYC